MERVLCFIRAIGYIRESGKTTSNMAKDTNCLRMDVSILDSMLTVSLRA